MASENWPTYVVIAFYIVATIGVTVIANRKNNDPNDSNSHVIKHFLASKNFGTLMLTLIRIHIHKYTDKYTYTHIHSFTTFASVFSGYTVVGVPNEAGNNGFTAVRWMSLIIVIGVSMLWLYPRLRRLSIVRSYSSPGDFIHDRFKSKATSILVCLLMCLPQLLYIGINIYSLGAVVDGLTGGELSFTPVVIFSTIYILLLEAFGGMRSVAYTDSVEAVVMVLVFISIPIMIASFTGGFIGMVNNSEDLTVPCDNSNADETSGCLNFAVYDLPSIVSTNSTASSLVEGVSEYYLRAPSSVSTLNYVLFTLSGVSFALNPHITQRCLTAKDDETVKYVVMCIFAVTFITMTPGILTGIAHISNKPDLNPDYADLPAFQAMLAEFRDRGGFVAFMSYIALLAGIAGIMSTADSALIGVSNTMSIDIFKNWVFPDYDDKKIVYIGKAISVTTMCLCLIFAIVIWETGAEYGVVYAIQQGLLWQAVPAYVFGLYTNFGTKSVLCGTSVGTVVMIILIAVVFGGNDPFPLVDKMWASLIGIGANVIVTVIAQYALFKEEDGQTSGGNDELSLDKIKGIMQGVTEPMIKWGGALVWISFSITLIAAFHWIDSVDDELVDEFGSDAVNELMYNGSVRNVIAGLPDYIFATLMWYVVAVGVGIAATSTWTVTDAGSIDKDTAQTDGGIMMEKVDTAPSVAEEMDDEVHGLKDDAGVSTDVVR